MRKWHRWFSVCFVVFLLWIAVTGVMIQIIPLFGPHEEHEHHAKGAPDATPAFLCPPDYTCRPKPKPDPVHDFSEFVHDLHSGVQFGLPGQVISTAAGLALIFFAISGLWMYIQMWRNRAGRNLKPRWFW